MPLNPSGAISLGGTTAGQSIALELGGPGTAQIALNDANVRTLAGVPSGVIIMPTDFYGKSNRATINLTISGNVQNYDVYTNRGPTYIAGGSDITVTVNPGIIVGSSSVPGYSMLVPSAFSPGDTVRIVNNGSILGMGGTGGNGAAALGPAVGAPGSSGGSAVFVNRPTTITNNGTIAGGGGGGGGGGRGQPRSGGFICGGGGGGGAGNSGGAGGAFGVPTNNEFQPYQAGSATNGGSGTPSSGGAGGSGGRNAPGANLFGGPGGPGGGLGSGGSNGTFAAGFPSGGPAGAGGSGGNYIVGNPFVTWPATGTRLGGVA